MDVIISKGLQISFNRKCKCGGNTLTRLKLKGWKRIIPWSRLYFCHRCKNSVWVIWKVE